LYDVTSTYFEGQAQAHPLAKRGYSRDHRPDCRPVCLGLVVTKCGMPLGSEVFAGNRADVTTLQEIVETMERQLLAEDGHAIREGLEVKLCPSPDGDGAPPPLYHAAHRTPSYSACAFAAQPSRHPSRGWCVVKTFTNHPLHRKYLRQQLANLG
jgi:hypothetical protein